MNEEFKFSIQRFSLPEASFKLLSSYRPESDIGSSLDQIIRRYSKIVEDAGRVRERFTDAHINYIRNVLGFLPLCADTDERLYDSVRADIETYLEVFEGDSFGLPEAWEEMLDQLSSLTIGEEVALVEFIEKMTRLDEVHASWPIIKMHDNNIPTF